MYKESHNQLRKVPVNITTEMIHAGYQTSKDVYHGRMDKNDAIKYLITTHGMSKGSAEGYIVNFKKMMDGEKFTLKNSKEQTDYILTKIKTDYGDNKLRGAIKAANEHVDYQKGLGTNLKGLRVIISQHEQALDSQEAIYPDDLDEPEALFEGVKKTIFVNSYERNPLARARCIEKYGAKCVVCGFDFGKKYGDIGLGFIHVHHLKQLADIKQGYEIHPIKDLRPVCPNCHAMLHKKKPPYTIEELKLKLCNNGNT